MNNIYVINIRIYQNSILFYIIVISYVNELNGLYSSNSAVQLVN